MRCYVSLSAQFLSCSELTKTGKNIVILHEIDVHQANWEILIVSSFELDSIFKFLNLLKLCVSICTEYFELHYTVVANQNYDE